MNFTRLTNLEQKFNAFSKIAMCLRHELHAGRLPFPAPGSSAAQHGRREGPEVQVDFARSRFRSTADHIKWKIARRGNDKIGFLSTGEIVGCFHVFEWLVHVFVINAVIRVILRCKLSILVNITVFQAI